jgi:sugar (pentulose or hexulose) kinase
VTPAFLDERPPRQDHGGATLRGVRPATTPADLFHATLEAITHRIVGIAETMAAVLPEPPCVAANGGALRSFPAWGQLVADALGTPVRAGHPDSTARGAAALVWERLGESMTPAGPGPETLPRPRYTELHRALRAPLNDARGGVSRAARWHRLRDLETAPSGRRQSAAQDPTTHSR